MSRPTTGEITLQASIDSLASLLHLKKARPSRYRQASECTLGRQDWELQCSRWWRWMHIHVLLPGSGSGGWEPHWRGWEPAWWQSSGAKLVSRWISQWWKMKCTQPSETNRQGERWAQSCQCWTFRTHTYSNKPINTLAHPHKPLFLASPPHMHSLT